MTPLERAYAAVGKIVTHWTGTEKAMIKLIQANEVQDISRQFSHLMATWKECLTNSPTDIDNIIYEATELHRMRNLVTHNIEHISVFQNTDIVFVNFLIWNHKPFKAPHEGAMMDEGHYLVHSPSSMSVTELESLDGRIISLTQALTQIHVAEHPLIMAKHKARWKPVDLDDLLNSKR